MNKLLVKKQLEHFFIEDIGEGDITTESVLDNNSYGEAIIKAKENGVMAGREVLLAGFEVIDLSISVHIFFNDGEDFKAGDTIASLKGPTILLLAGERVLLNLLQRMCGIATMTSKAIDILGDSSIRICDTRKTTPGLRQFEKYAVRCGGGFNHRRGLSDAVLLKENHILASGGITQAVSAVKESLGHMVKIEVETTNTEEVKEAVQAGVDVIMFDNASPSQVAKYVKLVPSQIQTEASGGISPTTLASYRGCGCNYISLGYLTHSIKAIDLSFLLVKGE